MFLESNTLFYSVFVCFIDSARIFTALSGLCALIKSPSGSKSIKRPLVPSREMAKAFSSLISRATEANFISQSHKGDCACMCIRANKNILDHLDNFIPWLKITYLEAHSYPQ